MCVGGAAVGAGPGRGACVGGAGLGPGCGGTPWWAGGVGGVGAPGGQAVAGPAGDVADVLNITPLETDGILKGLVMKGLIKKKEHEKEVFYRV